MCVRVSCPSRDSVPRADGASVDLGVQDLDPDRVSSASYVETLIYCPLVCNPSPLGPTLTPHLRVYPDPSSFPLPSFRSSPPPPRGPGSSSGDSVTRLHPQTQPNKRVPDGPSLTCPTPEDLSRHLGSTSPETEQDPRPDPTLTGVPLDQGVGSP